MTMEWISLVVIYATTTFGNKYITSLLPVSTKVLGSCWQKNSTSVCLTKKNCHLNVVAVWNGNFDKFGKAKWIPCLVFFFSSLGSSYYRKQHLNNKNASNFGVTNREFSITPAFQLYGGWHQKSPPWHAKYFFLMVYTCNTLPVFVKDRQIIYLFCHQLSCGACQLSKIDNEENMQISIVF